MNIYNKIIMKYNILLLNIMIALIIKIYNYHKWIKLKKKKKNIYKYL